MRGRQLVKFIRAVKLLARPSGATVDEIAEAIELSKRSAYRLFTTMSNLGFPVYDEKLPLDVEKHWKLDASFLKRLPDIKYPDIHLTQQEIISLYLLRSATSIFHESELDEVIQSSFEKLGLLVSDKVNKNIGKIEKLFISPSKSPKDYSEKEEIIDLLTSAILGSNTCLVKYNSFIDDTIKKFKIDPLHFFENDGGLYVLVNSTTFGNLRTLAIERIQEITITKDTFKYPKDLNAQELLSSSFDIVWGDPVDVKIWFDAKQAKYIKERRWSKTQEIKDLDDGSIILSIKTSGRWDVRRWVLSHGDSAKVLEPDDFRKEIEEELIRTLALY
ncbi:MAG: WYL domain-containing transcriptional regulator [Desulfobacterales bacterium]|nr:WYL domain-containing transcriptional regulator [Desulfobacterales bacterium]